MALALADRAGIQVPSWRIAQVAGKPVLVLHRFDRREETRVPFLSALSMLGARDNETRSYLEIADALRAHGAAPERDLRGLWRRMAFSVLISNTDDHLRNHGFLRESAEGWRLSPAYDLNPVPVEVRPRVLSTTIDFDDPTASLVLAFDVADYFALTPDAARTVAAEVGRAVAGRREEAERLGIPKAEIERMASAFEHEDLRTATASG